MTEKRFTLIKNTGTDECHSDNLYDNGTYIGAIEGGSEMICYLLNAQHEENKKLLTLSNMKKGALVEAVKELTEENEQLKQKLLSKKDIIQQMKIKLNEDYYKKWKKTNLNYIRVCEELAEENKAYEELAKENKQLKAQLYCDDEEGVCNICKHHYLVQNDEVELGYYNSRCRKGHYECARISLKYCEDFEKELEE